MITKKTPIFIIIVLVISLICCFNVYTSSNASPNVDFLQLVETNPNANVDAIISLDSIFSLEDIAEKASEYDVEINAFYHTFSTDSNIFIGGYVFPQSQKLSVDQLSQMQREYLDNINDTIRINEERLKVAQDETEKKARTVLIKDLTTRKTAAEQQGIPIYGLKVKGECNKIQNFVKNGIGVGTVVLINENDLKTMPNLPNKH